MSSEVVDRVVEMTKVKIIAAAEEHAALLDRSLIPSDLEIHQTDDAAGRFFTLESESNATVGLAESPDNVTTARSVEMFPHMDESGWKSWNYFQFS